jgi:hypothetical protein
LKLTICSSRYLTFQPSIGIAMSLNPDNNKNNDKKEDNENKRTRRIRRTYKRNDKPPIRRPMGVSALSISSIAATVVMLSSGAYFIAYAPSIHAEWHTSPPRQSSSYWLANPSYLIPSSSLVHITEVHIATFGWITIALASVPALVSFGLFLGRLWSWNASIIFFAVTSASLLLTFSNRGGGSIQVQEEEIGVNSVVQSLVYGGLSIVALYYLTRPRVKTFFGKNIATNDDDNNSSNSMQDQSPTMSSS